MASPAHSPGQTGQTPRLLTQLFPILLGRSRNLFPNDCILFSKRDRVHLKLINPGPSACGRGVRSEMGKGASLSHSPQPGVMRGRRKLCGWRSPSGRDFGGTLYPCVLAESPAPQLPSNSPSTNAAFGHRRTKVICDLLEEVAASDMQHFLPG